MMLKGKWFLLLFLLCSSVLFSRDFEKKSVVVENIVSEILPESHTDQIEGVLPVFSLISESVRPLSNNFSIKKSFSNSGLFSDYKLAFALFVFSETFVESNSVSLPIYIAHCNLLI